MNRQIGRKLIQLITVVVLALGVVLSGALHPIQADEFGRWQSTLPTTRAHDVSLGNSQLESVGNWNSVEELATYAATSINDYWAAEFTAARVAYYPPTEFGWYIQPISTACGPAEPNNAQYCALDHTITYDLNFFHALWQRYGDFAPVTVLAHEWGHLVQAHLNLLANPYRELMADCFAGNYANYAEQIGVLEPGDLEEAADILFVGGDPNLPWFTPGTHGRPEERVQAFQIGLSGDIQACFQAYGG